jgi:hypothetical protein
MYFNPKKLYILFFMGANYRAPGMILGVRWGTIA